MFKIFFYDLFQSVNAIKILLKCINKIFLGIIFSLIIYCFNHYIINNITVENLNALFFIVSYIATLFINYNPQRILLDPAIYKNNFYRFIFMIFNFLLSWPSILYISSLIILKTNIYTCILNYNYLLFSVLLTICFDKYLIFKLLILFLNTLIIFLCNPIITITTLFIFIIYYFIFKKKCFDEYEISKIRSNLIEASYDKHIKTTAIIVEWLFIIRQKKGLLFSSLFCSCGILCLFEYLSHTNPDVLCDLKNIRLLLLSSFVTGSFGTVFGPYMMNWFYFYSNDFLCKNWSINNIIKGKLDFLKLITLTMFIICIPFIILFKLNFFLLLYFFIMNSSISILTALIFGITETSKIDNTKSPRLRVEKGSVISTYIPWLCELIPVFIFKILYEILPIFGIVVFSIIVYGAIHLISEKIIDRLVFMINKKINLRSMI